MSTAVVIYLYIVIGKLITGLTILGLVMAAVSATLTIDYLIEVRGKTDDRWPKIKKAWVGLAAFLIVMGVSNVLYPNRAEVATIVGGSVIYESSQIKGAEKLPKNVVGAANRFLEGIGCDE